MYCVAHGFHVSFFFFAVVGFELGASYLHRCHCGRREAQVVQWTFPPSWLQKETKAVNGHKLHLLLPTSENALFCLSVGPFLLHLGLHFSAGCLSLPQRAELALHVHPAHCWNRSTGCEEHTGR
jgi:hypothetical protein